MVFKVWRKIKRIRYYFFSNYYSLKYRKEIKSRIKKRKCKPIKKTYAKEILRYYNSFGIKIKPYWHHYYSDINNCYSYEYIPEDYFYSTIDLALNKKEFSEPLMDKNLLDRIFKNVKLPKTVVKNINGYYYDANDLIDYKNAIDRCKNYKTLIIKPSIYSGGGKNVLVFTIKEGKTNYNDLTIQELFELYKKNFIIQEIVDQHETLKKLNPSSLNTIRVMSYLSEKEVFILSSFIRIGGKGMFVDNMASGGIACGIEPNGNLKKLGYNQYFDQVTKTDSSINLENIKIPSYDEITKTVKELHKQVPYFRLISWDMAVDSNGEVVLIENNLWGQGLNPHQVINGPIFNEHITEILKLSSKFKY